MSDSSATLKVGISPHCCNKERVNSGDHRLIRCVRYFLLRSSQPLEKQTYRWCESVGACRNTARILGAGEGSADHRSTPSFIEEERGHPTGSSFLSAIRSLGFLMGGCKTWPFHAGRDPETPNG